LYLGLFIPERFEKYCHYFWTRLLENVSTGWYSLSVIHKDVDLAKLGSGGGTDLRREECVP
jgi:hypothetical protein